MSDPAEVAGYVPDPPSKSDHHPQAVVTETVKERVTTYYEATCPTCGLRHQRDIKSAAYMTALECCRP